MSQELHSLISSIQPTCEYLIRANEYSAVEGMVDAFARQWPMQKPEATDFLAMLLHRSKHYKKAVAMAERTCALMPESEEARYNLAKCLHSAGEPEKAEVVIRAVVRARPLWPDPRLDLALFLSSQGKTEESLQCLLGAQALMGPQDPHHQVVRFNMGWHLLREGKFREGMAALAVGRELGIWGSYKNFPRPRLPKGADLRGRIVLFLGEGGAGDEIINARFAQLAKQRGARVVWSTQQGLQSVLARVAGIDEVVSSREAESVDCDFVVPAMDAASMLEVDLANLPNQAYLSAHPEHRARWAQKIPASPNLKVGLRWQGNQHYEHDLYRSVPFDLLRSLLDLGGTEFYSLQRDTGVEEMRSTDRIVDLAPDLRTWEDTLAAIAQLDLVVTSCTSIAHLAAALGKPTWVMVPVNSYFIWALPGDTSPWYEHVNLVRQATHRSWEKEVARVKINLGRLAQSKEGNTHEAQSRLRIQ